MISARLPLLRFRTLRSLLAFACGLAAPAWAVPAANVTATKDDGVAAVTRKLVGDTINYTITISNTGTDATGVTLTDPTPTNTTLVSGSVHASPLAFADAYTAVGNTKLYVGVTPPSGEPAASLSASSGLFANDVAVTDSLVYVSNTNPAHGTVTVNSDGTFVYTPTAGYSGADSFTYTIKNSVDATLTDTGTVSITVTNPVWYVNNSGGPGTGTSTSPFASLASVNGAGGSGDSDGAGDTIYVYKGNATYTGGLPLESNQRLVSETTALVVGSYTLRAAVPANTPTLSHTTGSTVTLSANNTLSGFIITNSNGNGINGSSVGTAALSGISVSATNGSALSATGSGTLTVTGSANTLSATSGTALKVENVTIGTDGLTFRSISSSGGTAAGIILDTTGTQGGLTVTGDGSDTTLGGNDSGGVIASKDDGGVDGSGTVGTGIYLNNTANVTLSRMRLSDLSNFGIRGLSVTKFTMQYCTINGTNGDSVAYSEGCLAFGTPGPSAADGFVGTGANASSISNCKFSGGLEHNLEIYGTSAAFTLSLMTCDVKNNDTTLGANGLLLELFDTSTATVTVQACTFDGNRAAAVQAIAEDSSSLDLSLNGNRISRTAQGTEGFVLSNAGNGRLTTHVSANTISGLLGTAIFVGQAAENASASSNLTAVITANTINQGDATHYGINRAILAFLSSTSGQAAPASLKIEANTVNVFSDPVAGLPEPIFVSTPDAGTSPSFNATVLNNLVTILDPGQTALRGIAVQATQSSTGVFDVRSNLVTYTSGTPTGVKGVRVRQSGSGTAQLAQGSSSLGNPAGTVLADNNAASSTEVLGTVTVVANGTFTAPSLQLAPSAAEPAAARHVSTTGNVTASDDGLVSSMNSARPAPAAETSARLTPAELEATVAEALRLWADAGLPAARLERLRALSFEVASLPDRKLGEAIGHRIRVDALAGGRGWSVATEPASAATGRVDLLTTLLHEMGHALGLEDTYLATDRSALMYGFLGTGERRLPTRPEAAAAAQATADSPVRAHFLSAPLSIGTLPAGKSVTVKYQVTITSAAASISNQGTISGTNFSNVLTDDPTVVGSANATVTTVELAPTVTTLPASVNEDATLTFSAATFDGAYSDANSDQLATVRITSLPSNGLLKLGGNTFTVPQDIARADLGTLTYVPNANYYGSDSFGWNASDGTLFATTATTASLTVNAVNDNPVLGSVSSTASYTENASAVVLSPLIAITDVDNTTIAAAAVSISAGGVTGDTLAATVTGTAISASYNSGTRILTLSGTDTVANYQAVLRTVTYVSSSENPTSNGTATTRTIAWLVDDGGAANNYNTSMSTTLTLTAVNDAPSITAPASLNGLTSTAFALSGISFGDVDGGSASEVVSLSVPSGTLAATSGGGVVVASSSAQAMTLTGSIANLNAFLSGGNVTYTGTATVSLSIGIDDQGNTGGSALTGSATVSLVINAPPVVTTSGGSTTFTEASGTASTPVAVDPTLTLSDSDTATLASATVSITGNFSSSQDSLAFTNDGSTMGNVTASYTTATGVLTLTSSTASATLTEWQAALRAVTYTNGSDDPDTSNRTVSFTVNDGIADSSAATRTVALTAVNDAPTLTATGGTPTYTENGSAADLFSSVSVSTVESGQTIVQLVLTVTNLADGSSEILRADGTDITLTNATSGTTASNSLSYSVSVAGTTATVTLAKVAGISSATTASLVDALSYRNASENPGTANRVVTLTSLRDSGGTASSGVDTATLAVAATVTVAAVNDAPTITAPATLTVTEDESSALTGISFADVDAGSSSLTASFSVGSGTLAAVSGSGVTVSGSGTASLTLAGSLANLNAYVAAGSLGFTTASNATANVTLSVGINDGGNTGTGGAKTDSTTVTLLVTAVNDTPVNTVPSAQSVNQDATLTFSSGNANLISVADVDAAGSNLQVTLTATHGVLTLSGTTGLSFTTGTGTANATMTFTGTLSAINTALSGLTYTPTTSYNGSASVQIDTSDLGNTGTGGTKTDSDTVSITVNPINPTVVSVSSSTTNGTYRIGDAITITVRFSETVTVNTGGGAPSLLLETGATDRSAAYASGSGTNTLSWIYTVQAGDVSADLDYQGTTALALNGGTIRGFTSLDALLTLPTLAGPNSLAGQKALVIDGVVPTVSSVTVPANGTYIPGQNLDFTVNFSEAVTVNGGGGTPSLAVTLDTGGTVQATYLSGSGTTALLFRTTVAAGQNDPTGIVVGSALSLNGGTVRDAAGNDATLTLNSVGATSAVKVDSLAPSVTSITRVSTSPTRSASLAFTVTFSEAVTGVDPADFALTSTGSAAATVATATPAGTGVYTVTITNVTGNGTLRLDFKASGTGVTDTPGNAITVGFTTGEDYLIDTSSPVVSGPTAATGAVGSLLTSLAYVSGESTVTLAATGLPAGLVFDPATGFISGTPAVSGTFTVRITATDAAGNVGFCLLALRIDRGLARVELQGLSQTYTGQPRTVTVVTRPAGLPVILTYVGLTSAPTAAGTYAVTATVNHPEWLGLERGDLVVAKAAQTVDFTMPGPLAIGTPLTLTARASSGLPVTFSLVSGNAALTGSTLTLRDGAPVVVRASQPGDENTAAAAAERTLAADKLPQTITFAQPADRRVGEPAVLLTASASSGLPVTFTVVSGPAALTGASLTLTGGTGPVVVRASQAGNATYAGAPDVVRTFTVAAATQPNRFTNLSTRAVISAPGGRTLITGFVIAGSAPQQILLRAVGPALAGFGVTDAATNPRLQVYDGTGRLILENDDWSGADTAAAARQVGAFELPAGSRDAALLTSLPPGAYTMHLLDAGRAGVVLAEIYDAATSGASQRFVNLSSRGNVTGEVDVLIGGFVVTGTTPKRMLIRGSGPALAGFGVTGALPDPQLAIFSGSTLVARNDDWSTASSVPGGQAAATAAEIAAAAQAAGAFAFTAGTKDAAVLVTLPPGAYTALVSGANATEGAALVEIYELTP